MAKNPLIMVVDDSPEDFEMIARAFVKCGSGAELARCQDGEEALASLRAPGARRPDMILLDLNMPGTDGHETLSAVKSDPALKEIPVIVLSSTGNPKEVRSCYANGANSFFRKPVDAQGLSKAIEALVQYWLRTASLGGDNE